MHRSRMKALIPSTRIRLWLQCQFFAYLCKKNERQKGFFQRPTKKNIWHVKRLQTKIFTILKVERTSFIGTSKNPKSNDKLDEKECTHKANDELWGSDSVNVYRLFQALSSGTPIWRSAPLKSHHKRALLSKHATSLLASPSFIELHFLWQTHSSPFSWWDFWVAMNFNFPSIEWAFTQFSRTSEQKVSRWSKSSIATNHRDEIVLIILPMECECYASITCLKMRDKENGRKVWETFHFQAISPESLIKFWAIGRWKQHGRFSNPDFSILRTGIWIVHMDTFLENDINRTLS